MTIKALNPFAPTWYTPKGEAKADKPTRFKLRGLDGAEQSEVAPEIGPSKIAGMMDLTADALRLLLKYGLLGWENFDNDLGPIEFNEYQSIENQKVIPYKVQTEIAARIFELTFLPPPLKKK